MTGADPHVGGPEQDEAVEPIVWSVHLAKRQPQKMMGIALAASIVAVVGVLIFQNVVLSLFGVAAILFSTAEFTLPLRYRLDATGASVRVGFSVTALQWCDVKRILVSDEGIKLSPLPAPSRLDPFRGVFLRTDGDLDELLLVVQRLAGNHARLVEGRTDRGGDGTPAGQGGTGDSEAEA